MILFAVKKTHDENNGYEISEAENIIIPVTYDTNEKINENNIQLISWNQAIYKPKENDPEKQIKNVDDLFETILEVAKGDSVCQDMNEQFHNLYNEYIFILPPQKEGSTNRFLDNNNDGIFKNFLNNNDKDNIKEDDGQFIIKMIYDTWPHPIIGNVITSPKIGPQTSQEQYDINWNVFNSKYMSDKTKTTIQNMVVSINKSDDKSDEGLKKLKKSGRDQFRIYKDWTELARAVIGEITSYISNLLEEIYAQDLVKSDNLNKKQKDLLSEIVNYNKYDYKTEDSVNKGSLEDLFKSFDDCLERTEYIYDYLDKDKISAHSEIQDLKWKIFASLISEFVTITIDKDAQEVIKEIIKPDYQTLPQPIKCAMIFHAISQFIDVDVPERFSIFTDPTDSNKNKYLVEQSISKEFIPEIKTSSKKNSPSWSWMRDEKEESTIAYRHFLMPLWTTPSNRVRRLLAFYNTYFNDKQSPAAYFKRTTELANVLLPSMFAFYRLYYDKRISDFHTLAETYEAIFFDCKNHSEWDASRIDYCNRLFNKKNVEVQSAEKPQPQKPAQNDEPEKYDAYDTLEKIVNEKIEWENGIYSSIAVMQKIFKQYCKKDKLSDNIGTLKSIINNNKNPKKDDPKKEDPPKEDPKSNDEQKIKIIDWEQDISDSKEKVETSDVLSNVVIVSQVLPQKHKTTEKKESEKKEIALTDEETRIDKIFNKIKDSSSIQFKPDLGFSINPPKCLTENKDNNLELQDFIGGMTFQVADDHKPNQEGQKITFTATVDTSSDCWKFIKQSTVNILKETETISCTVFENENLLMFRGEISLKDSFVEINNVKVTLKSLIIESGLDSDWISVQIVAAIINNESDDEIEITLNQPTYSNSIYISADYKDGKVLSVKTLCNLFNLDIDSILPSENNQTASTIFGTFGLQSLKLALSIEKTESVRLSKINFVLTTSNPWSVYQDKISIEPIFEIDIDNPGGGNQRIYWAATGRGFIGQDDKTTEFDVSVTSDKIIYAGLAERAVLNIQNILESFSIKDSPFPDDLKFTDISLMADINTYDYSFSVTAENLCKIGIFTFEGLSCSLDYTNGKFGDVDFSGIFKYGEIKLYVHGKYSNANFAFSSNVENYKTSEFIKNITGEKNIPDNIGGFADAYIKSIDISYNSQNSNFSADAEIDDIFNIQSFFSIDKVKLSVSSSNKDSSNNLIFKFDVKTYIKYKETKQIELEIKYDSDTSKENGDNKKSTYHITYDSPNEPTQQGITLSDILTVFYYTKTAGDIPDFPTDPLIKKIDITYEIDTEEQKKNEPETKKSSLSADIVIEDVLKIKDVLSIDELKLQISSTSENTSANDVSAEKKTSKFQICASMSICDKPLNLSFETTKNNSDSEENSSLVFSGSIKDLNLKIGDHLANICNKICGNIDISPISNLISKIIITSIDAKLTIESDDKTKKENGDNNEDENTKTKKFELTINTEKSGKITLNVKRGPKDADNTWSVTYEPPSDTSISILNLPVISDFIKTISPNIDKGDKNYCITDIKLTITKDGPSLNCKAFGYDIPEQKKDPQPQQQNNQLVQIAESSGPSFTGSAVWKNINKTICIFNIQKVGLGVESGHIAVLIDASLNISPLTISLNGAGIGIAPNEDPTIKFYLSGFGIGFDNGVLSIAGGLSAAGLDENKNPQYSGMISIRFKEVGLTAIGQYTKIITGDKETASLCACFSLLAPIGGIPAFFVRGIAGGFGYNERLILPSIENVNDHFLVQAAMGTHSNNLDDLRKNVNEEDGQYFLAAGLKFTSFELIEGCVLVTVSFGNDCELGILGLADISIPPKAKNSAAPIAYAQLALKASIKPSEGFFSAEAQLTNESYILSKDCKLTGGFAAYAWFGDNEHSGDFVVTLGGYAPSYQKPDHYPTVPRLGINWKVDDHININGEMYFAVTPSNLMAGGKLCATYTQGDLKAWFIAYADILMDWKPFRYDVRIGASVGASYTLDLWLVKKTFSIELSADLHLWGPDLQGTVDISWYIISFTISFGGGNKQEEDLDWNGFINSFFASKEQAKSTNDVCRKELTNDDNDPINKDILSISLDGVIGNTQDDCKGIDIISPYQLVISAISNIPMNKDKNGNDIGCVIVKPVKDKTITPSIEINITDASKNNFDDKFNHDFITRKLPSALWIPEKRSNIETVNEFCVGKKISLDVENYLETATNFPINKDLWISIQELAEKNLILKSKCFDINEGQEHELNVDNYTIKEFSSNYEKDNLENVRKEYIQSIYTDLQDLSSIDISFAHADTLFSEDFLKTSEKEELKNEQ